MEANQQANKPKTLQKIAYVSIPDSTDLEFLLWDLQDAIAAYAQLSGTALPHPVDLKANSADTADGIVLAVEDTPVDEAVADIAKALDRFGDTGTRVYVVVQAACERTEGACMLIERLRQACELRRLTWCGGVIACTGSGIREALAWNIAALEPDRRVYGVDLGPDFVPHGATDRLYALRGLDSAAIAEYVRRVIPDED